MKINNTNNKEKIPSKINSYLDDQQIILDEIFEKNINTVLLYRQNQPLSLPIINLNTNDKLTMSFDDLDEKNKNYYFKIIHCDKDWKRSNLFKSQYTQGFSREYIKNYQRSFSTLQKYIHYRFDFPTENMRPLISGNYVLQIYLNDTLRINKRFFVLDKQVNITANTKRATSIKNRNTKHEIDFIVNHSHFIITDPYSEINVVIKQNNQDYDAKKRIKPTFIRNNELIYNYENENMFNGNNEFRHFNIKDLKYHSDQVNNIILDSIHNYVKLIPDIARPFKRYLIKPDINGKFDILNQNDLNKLIETDYCWVYFYLPMEEICNYGEIYIIGELTNWQVQEKFKLKYNLNTKLYETSVLLKQGYYNYHYALNDTILNKIDVSYIEGTHYETKNDYYIYVYYKKSTDEYDQLIGLLKTSSKILF
ncbi:MAG: DUF5103 domain-containing protein [Bacteroidota bacterium]|nr:DUF5103 domain-containing protein [Bacteroidota bacterium]